MKVNKCRCSSKQLRLVTTEYIAVPSIVHQHGAYYQLRCPECNTFSSRRMTLEGVVEDWNKKVEG